MRPTIRPLRRKWFVVRGPSSVDCYLLPAIYCLLFAICARSPAVVCTPQSTWPCGFCFASYRSHAGNETSHRLLRRPRHNNAGQTSRPFLLRLCGFSYSPTPHRRQPLPEGLFLSRRHKPLRSTALLQHNGDFSAAGTRVCNWLAGYSPSETTITRGSVSVPTTQTVTTYGLHSQPNGASLRQAPVSAIGLNSTPHRRQALPEGFLPPHQHKPLRLTPTTQRRLFHGTAPRPASAPHPR